MACSSSPTLTTTILETTSTITTSLSNSLTTTPASTVTITSTSCLASASASGASGCVSSTVITSLSTIDEVVNTVQVPVTITVPVTLTEIETLYGSACSQSQSQSRSDNPTPPPTQPPSPPPSPGPDQSVSSVLSEYTPPPVIVSQKSFTTLSDGQVSETVMVSTSQPPPSLTYIATLVPNPQTQADDRRGGSAEVGPIIGGTLGGFFGLIAIVLFGWFLIRRRKRWDDIFDGDDDDHTVSTFGRKHKRFSLDVDDEPKPYQYGLVGHVTPPPAATSSPPTSPRTHNNLSLSSSRTPSHVAMASISSSSRGLSRPSTPGSTMALRPNALPPATSSFPSPTHSPANSIHQPPARHSSSSHTDYFADIDLPSRVGSPTSFREPIGRLHIANATRSPTSSMISLNDDVPGFGKRQSVQTRMSMLNDGTGSPLLDTRVAGSLPRSPPPYTD